MNRILTGGLLGLSLLTLSPVMAEPPSAGGQRQAASESAPTTHEAPKPAAFPSTPLGNVASNLVNTLNQGDPAAIHRFVKQYIGTHLYMPWTPERYERMFRKLAQQSGGLDVQHIQPMGNTLGVFVHTRQGNHALALEIVADTQEPAKLSLVGMHPMNEPLPMNFKETGQKLDAAGITGQLQQYLEKVSAADRFSGVVLIAQGDRILLQQAYGQADKAKSVPNTLQTRFHTGSIGKMFTAVAIGQLVEQGKLSFSDTLAKALPEYPDAEVARKVTIQQLLTHTTGIPDFFGSPRFQHGKTYPNPEAAISVFAGLPLDFEPGSRFDYSNSNFIILAAIVRKASGQTYLNYLRTHVFKPAGMDAADLARNRKHPTAVGYSHYPESDPLGIETRRANPWFVGKPDRDEIGNGGFYLTAEDMFRFFRALRGHKLLSADMTDKMTQGQVSIAPNSPFKYGYGFYDIPMEGVHMRGHSGGGSNSGIGAHTEMLWEPDYTVIVLGNYDLEEDVRPLTLELVRFLAHHSLP